MVYKWIAVSVEEHERGGNKVKWGGKATEKKHVYLREAVMYCTCIYQRPPSLTVHLAKAD